MGTDGDDLMTPDVSGFDPARWIAVFEQIFGKKLGYRIFVTVFILGLVSIVSVLLKTIWNNGGKEIYNFITGLTFPELTAPDFVQNLLSSIAFGDTVTFIGSSLILVGVLIYFLWPVAYGVWSMRKNHIE